MTGLASLKKTLCVAALALPLTSGFAVIASAHSTGVCTDSVVIACNAQYPNNYKARISCVNGGISACQGHSHGGGSTEPATNNFSAGSNPELNRVPRFKKFKR